MLPSSRSLRVHMPTKCMGLVRRFCAAPPELVGRCPSASPGRQYRWSPLPQIPVRLLPAATAEEGGQALPTIKRSLLSRFDRYRKMIFW